MRVFGIDPGTATVGFGVIDYIDGNYSYVTCGVISTPAGLPEEERLLMVSQDLSELLSRHNPSLIGIEDLFFCKNLKTAIKVAQARGVMLLEAQKSGSRIVSMTPLQVKQAVTTYGGADKNQVGEMVKSILSLNVIPKPDDAADALAVAVAAIMHSRK